MGGLLIHSMRELAEVLSTSLQFAGAKHVVEIGSESGTMTGMLVEYTRIEQGSLVSIDASPAGGIAGWFAEQPHARLVQRPSLEVLPDLDADAWLVDGDHNYYTVLHESRLIWERAHAAERPFLAFYHDVAWPWARRDLYSDPARIPAEFVQPHTGDLPLPLEASRALGNASRQDSWACARREGGPHNGVLIAIEDFAADKADDLAWACVPAVFGLGVLYDRRAPWTEKLAHFLAPHQFSGQNLHHSGYPLR